MTAAPTTRPSAIEIRIGDVDLATMLDALGAAVAAVREAHRDTMSTRGWAALHRAQENIAEAMMDSSKPLPLPAAKVSTVSGLLALSSQISNSS
jgi:hypothetical protein